MVSFAALYQCVVVTLGEKHRKQQWEIVGEKVRKAEQ